MPPETTNLLPQARLASLRRDYRYRLVVVGVWLFVALILMGGVLLLPSYVYLSSTIGAKQAKLDSVKQTLSTTDEAAINARLKALAGSASTLVALAKMPSPTKIVSEILTVPRTGITLTGFVFTPATDKAQTSVVISGTAKTRNALRDYQLILQNTAGITSANLPVSAYARDTDIDFSLTLTFAP